MFKLEHIGEGHIFYATEYSAGFDIPSNEDLILKKGTRALISTGLRIIESYDVPPIDALSSLGTCVAEIQLRPRSGLALKFGISVLNAPSTIDADYRGEIKVILINHGDQDFEIKKGERIAQAVVALAFRPKGIEVKEKIRGQDGFGSTGKTS
jgi:dUTP pyrophosphatase